MSNIRDFIFKRDLWAWDLASSVVFAMGLSALWQRLSDDLSLHVDRILYAMLLAALSYLGVFAVGFYLKRKLSFIRSWAWMGTVGAFIQILPMVWNVTRFWDEFRDDLWRWIIPGILMHWALWTVGGCCFILFIRLIPYFLATKKPLP